MTVISTIPANGQSLETSLWSVSNGDELTEDGGHTTSESQSEAGGDQHVQQDTNHQCFPNCPNHELTKHNRGWRRVVRNFTPSYVALSLAHSSPWQRLQVTTY